MDKLNEKVMECYSCGLFVNKQKAKRDLILCPRCGTKLLITTKHSVDSLYFAISALLLFVLLNTYSLISLSVNGKELQTTLIGVV